jgi:hypothetical protein
MPIELRRYPWNDTIVLSLQIPYTGPTQLKAVDEPEAYASTIDLTEE